MWARLGAEPNDRPMECQDPLSRGALSVSSVPVMEELFGEQAAESYDDHFAKLSVMRDALHLVTYLALHELPEDAHLLSVGAGTGAELLDLGARFPRWRFTAVEPSEPMLRRCRAKAEAAGMASRCTFHHGTIESLPAADFDGATAILVSQFIVDRDARVSFFREIAARLRPGAPLVSADLAIPEPLEPAIALWRAAWRHAGHELPENLLDAFAGKVALLPPAEVQAILAEASFEPVPCYQSILIHGWLARLNRPH